MKGHFGGLFLFLDSRGIMRKTMNCVAIGLTLSLGAHCHAEEFLFAGQVQQLTYKPSGVGDCPPPCGWPKPAKEGIEMVCITNQGACQIAQIKVIQDYLASNGARSYTIEARTGEWGGHILPMTDKTLLIFSRKGGTWWAPIIERDGKQFVEPNKLRMRNRDGERLFNHDIAAQEPIDTVIEKIKAGKL
jgi:hypothetical protein